MRWRWMLLLAPAGLLASLAASAQMQPVADCAALSIHLTGVPEAADARCQSDASRSNELIDASGPGRVFVIRHQASNRP